MDLVLEPGCFNPRAHPRWMKHRVHLRDTVVPGSRPQAPPANVTDKSPLSYSCTCPTSRRARELAPAEGAAPVVPLALRASPDPASASPSAHSGPAHRRAAGLVAVSAPFSLRAEASAES